VEDNSVQDFIPHTTDESGGSSGTVCLPNLLGAGESNFTKSHKKTSLR